MLPTTTANNILSYEKLSTGIASVDAALGGGIPLQGIFEVCGESGSGKTQLCLQLSLNAQYPLHRGGLNGGVVYVCTESKFPSKRFQQMLDSRLNGFSASKTQFSDNLHIIHAADVDTLNECIKKKLLELKGRCNIKLLIIDSVAAIFRSSYENADGMTRAKDLRSLGGYLHNLSMMHNVAVVCVNQVSDEISTGKKIPSLGLAWSNMVTTRIQMSRLHGKTRQMNVKFSPILPKLEMYCNITDSGLSDCTGLN